MPGTKPCLAAAEVPALGAYDAAMDFETRAIHAGQEPDSATGVGDDPDLPDVDLRPGGGRRPQGLRLRARREPDPHRARGVPGVARERGARARVLVRHRRDDDDHAPASTRATTSSASTTSTAAPTGCSRRCTSRRATASRTRRRSSSRPTRPPTSRDARLVWIESPTNPLLNIVDIAAVAAAARAAGALLVVDNTFATPYLQTPLDLGADIVVHSTTKYLGGHSDVVGGFAATNDPTIAERLRFLQKSLGAVPGPFDAWLVLRGLKTLAVRMDRHCANARAVVEFLGEHPRVTRVLWPGLPDHPGHEIAARQMRDFGGMVSFLVETEDEGRRARRADGACGRSPRASAASRA